MIARPPRPRNEGRQAVHKGIRFVVVVNRDDASYLTNPAEPLTDRAGCLAQLVEDGHARAGGSRVPRGYAAIACLAVVDQRLAYHLLADEPTQRRRQLAAVVAHDSFLFCGASLAEPGAPAVEWHGIPLEVFEAAQAAQLSLDARADGYAPALATHGVAA